MNPWIIAGLCLFGSGFVAWGSARLRLRWPLPALNLLLMAISLQLLFAARGQGGFHDLAAIIAQTFTTVPALLGVVTGLALAHIRRYKIRWQSASGLISAIAFGVAAAAAATTFLI
jgi:hypothetical protein